MSVTYEDVMTDLNNILGPGADITAIKNAVIPDVSNILAATLPAALYPLLADFLTNYLYLVYLDPGLNLGFKSAQTHGNENIVATGVVEDHSCIPEKMWSQFALKVVQTGVVTSWTVLIQVDLDGSSNWITALSHTKAGNGDKVSIFSAPMPAQRYRVNVTALTLGGGTSITVYSVAG